MKIEPKIAIACRDKVEIEVALQMLERAGIRWYGGSKATQRPNGMHYDECRLYIYPADSRPYYNHIVYSEDVDDFTYDDGDGFEWTYVEASNMFKNQIISERRKNVHRT